MSNTSTAEAPTTSVAFALVADNGGGDVISRHRTKRAAESAKSRHPDRRPKIVPLNGSPGSVPASSQPSSGARQIPLASIEPSPHNPRKVFEPEALQQLANSLANPAVGQLQEAVVRVHPTSGGDAERYELIGGERRFRAAQLAGLETLRCRVIEADDALAIELTGIENYEREQLNAVEEAGWFRSMLDPSGGGYTQQALAKRLGISQAKISQRLALLDLPEAWRDRIITGVIPATWARELTPWAKRPQVLAALDEQMGDEPAQTLDEFRRLLDAAIEDCTRPLSGWVNGFGYVTLRPGKKHRDELDIVELVSKTPYGAVHKAKRCFNVALWEELAKASAEREKKRRAREDAKRRAKEAGVEVKPGAPVDQLSQKVTAADRARAFARKLYAYKVAWLQDAIAGRVSAEQNLATNTRLLLYLTTTGGGWRDVNVEDCVDQIAGELTNAKRATSTWERLAGVPTAMLDELIVRIIRAVIDSEANEHRGEDVEAIAAALGIDLAAPGVWRIDREFLELHDKAGIVKLCQENNRGWKVHAPSIAGKKRGEMIDAILKIDGERPLCAPKSLIKAKPA